MANKKNNTDELNINFDEIKTFDDLLKINGEITASKGFNVKRVPEQIALFCTEIAELLASINYYANTPDQTKVVKLLHQFKDDFDAFERFRKTSNMGAIKYYISDKENFKEEIADLFIRLLSFCSVNIPDIEQVIIDKMKINSGRQYLHGKKF